MLFLVCLLAGCGREEAAVPALPEESSRTDSLTLLERAYADVTGDGDEECIELYTSALATDGRIGWDTGHQWSLLVKDGEDTFTVVDEWIQYGELLFWAVDFAGDNADGAESETPKAYIYIAVTTDVSFELLRAHWDEAARSYEKESVFKPPNQWTVRHSNKYSTLDPSYFE
jgi:hypothetical protein